MFGINLKVIVAMVTELCTHSISAMAYNAIPVLILKSQRHNFSQTNNFSQIIKFGVDYGFFFLHTLSLCFNLCYFNKFTLK